MIYQADMHLLVMVIGFNRSLVHTTGGGLYTGYQDANGWLSRLLCLLLHEARYRGVWKWERGGVVPDRCVSPEKVCTS
jgi:hypothetical protein